MCPRAYRGGERENYDTSLQKKNVLNEISRQSSIALDGKLLDLTMQRYPVSTSLISDENTLHAHSKYIYRFTRMKY